jgi:hypothetical protein
MLDKTTARKFIAPRRQGAKLRIFSEFSELGVFAPLRETRFFQSLLHPKISNIFG